MVESVNGPLGFQSGPGPQVSRPEIGFGVKQRMIRNHLQHPYSSRHIYNLFLKPGNFLNVLDLQF